MRVHVLHRDKRWRRPQNHLDGRVCPDCGATSHGWAGQRKHQGFHVQLAELLADLAQRAGVEDRPETPWTAAVDGGQDEREALDG
jgi:hypothetical protein